MKNRSINILIASLCLLGIMAVILVVAVEKAHSNFDKNIMVSSNGVTETTLAVRDLKLNPADKKEYSINLVCEASGSYDICLTYDETHDGGMKHFVNVKVFADEKNVYSGSLTDLLDKGTTVEFEGTLEAKKPLVVTIRYEMPYEIGNEAQGTSTDFDVTLKVVKN